VEVMFLSLEENKVIVQRWIDEVWSSGKMAAIDELLAADFVFNYAPNGAEPNVEAYKQVIAMYSTAVPGTYTIEDMVAERDKVAARWSYLGIHKGEFMGVAPTGKQVTGTGMSILRIVDGKIVEEWSQWDNLSMLQQLGIIPSIG